MIIELENNNKITINPENKFMCYEFQIPKIDLSNRSKISIKQVPAKVSYYKSDTDLKYIQYEEPLNDTAHITMSLILNANNIIEIANIIIYNGNSYLISYQEGTFKVYYNYKPNYIISYVINKPLISDNLSASLASIINRIEYFNKINELERNIAKNSSFSTLNKLLEYERFLLLILKEISNTSEPSKKTTINEFLKNYTTPAPKRVRGK